MKKTDKNLLSLGKDATDCILSFLDLADIDALKHSCTFFRDYDYTVQNRRIAKQYLAQASIMTNEQLKLSLTYRAACLANIAAILVIWQRQLKLALQYAQLTHSRFKESPREALIETWAKDTHPFLYYCVMSYQKAQELHDGKMMLRVAYRSSILYNKNKDFRCDAGRFFAATQQDPNALILNMLAQSEEAVDERTRHQVQKSCNREAHKILKMNSIGR